ncbi:C-type lectin domain family 12 member B-like [Rana temporaria]|uniref:C-type lectin domain family 12 member B-like n=1 Tax=Rana temporaria TaxID=8407 RepID=UPI001AAC5B94|nr:C-type lectin domain family 12 member B-like [Rana temporaria]
MGFICRGCDSEGVVYEYSYHNVVPTATIMEHTVQEYSVYDNWVPTSSGNTLTKLISRNLTFTSSKNKNETPGSSCSGCLVPALLTALLSTCAILQLVLIILRASGTTREVKIDDYVPDNRSQWHVPKEELITDPPRNRRQQVSQCARFYIQRNQTQQGRSSGCPPFWIGINDKCYFFSEEKKPRTDGDEDCTNRNSRLAQVKEETLQALVTLTGQAFWVGITLYNSYGGVWTGGWADGSMVNVTEGIGTCAKLGPRLMLENCYIPLRWICERDAV